MAALAYFFPGLVIFIFLPAAIFAILEDWTYLDSFYSSFMTLTTIGFGDIVPSYTGSATLFNCYLFTVNSFE